MSDDYVKLVPDITGNPTTNAIILTAIPATAYVLATYMPVIFDQASYTFVIILAFVFLLVEYIIKIPLVKYSSEVAGLSNFSIQLIWVVLILALSAISDLFMKKKQV
jgi:hypothetical protein